MDDQNEVVIRDPQGTEHVFPAGFDPQKAAAIVRASGQSTQLPPTDTMAARMSPHDISDAPDGPPSQLNKLNAMLQAPAHPQEAGDFTSLLLPSGGAAALGKALAPVGEAISRYGGAAAKVAGAAATTMLPPAIVTPIRGALKVLGELKPSEWNSPLTVAGREGRAHAAVAGMVERYKPNVSGAVDAGGAAQTSRIPYAPPSDAPPVAAAGAATDTSVDAQLRAAGLDPSKVISSTQGAKQGATSMTSGRLVKMGDATRPPITVIPESPMQPPSPLQEPRVQVGADALARGSGQTPTQIRTAAGPVGAEAVGAPREGMPDKPFERVFNSSLEQPRGAGRASYADAGNGEKTRIQTNAIARAQDYIGKMRDSMPPEQFADWIKKFVLVGTTGASVPSVRDLVMKKLGADQQ